MFKFFSAGIFILLIAGCGAPRPRQSVSQCKDDSPSRLEMALPGRAYRIDASQSELRVLVYRAGPMASFGHNHVLLHRDLCGAVRLRDQTSASAFWLKIPAGGFVVDDAQARREEGPDFAAEVSDGAKSGTQENMLGAAVLNAVEFPAIVVHGGAVVGAQRAPSGGTPDAATLIATVAVSVAGHETKIDVPLTLQVDSSRVSASGTLVVRQSTLGLTPYSLMLGALQVQDGITIKFKIVGRPI